MREVKNFCISKYEYSAFFCTKNHCHILKTRENSHQWSATILKQWKKYFWKIDFWKFEIFKFFFCFKMVAFHWKLFSRVFKIWQWFLVQKKAEYSYFEMQKFFTPSLVFYPLFYVRNLLKIGFEHSNTPCSNQKRG